MAYNPITQCPYICNVDLLWHPDHKSRPVTLDYTGTDGVIKAGTPISAAGAVANNGSAIGILLRDCYDGFHAAGNVVIDGFIRQDVAAEHSGVQLTDDAKRAMSKLVFIDTAGIPDPAESGGSGGSGGAQPDWSQNDETAADYVKNRPFYTGNPVENVLVEESTVSFEEDSGLYGVVMQSTFEATVGETYKVSWDGSIYECTCVDFNGYTTIGNLSIAGAGADTGEPFIMVVYNDRSLIEIYTADTSSSHTFSISGFVSEVLKIDEKYLPKNSVFYTGDPANWNNEKKQQMYDDFISGKPVFYRYTPHNVGIVLNVFYSEIVGLQFVFFENYHDLILFNSSGFSEGIDLSEYGLNSRINDLIRNLTT